MAATRLPSAPRSTSWRTLTGHHRLELQAVGVLAAPAQVLAERARHGGEHDVVDRAAQRVLDRLDVAQVGAHPGEAPMRSDVLVVRARGRRVEPRPGHGPNSDGGVARPGEDAARAAQNGTYRPSDLARDRRAFEQRLREQLRAAGKRARKPALTAVGGGCRLARGVEQNRQDVDARDAVHECVVGLREHGEAVVLETLDQPDLPERLVAVELLGEHPAGEILELVLGPGGGEGGRAHVVAQVQMGIVDPARPALAERHEGEPLAVARHEPETALEGLEQLVVGGRRPLEDHHRRHVHVRGGVLEVQEGSVEPGQTVGGHASEVSAP